MASESARLRVEELTARDVPSAAGGDLVCHHVNTSLSAHQTGLSNTGGSTAGEIRSGLLRGTTVFNGIFTDAAGDYIGTLTITTKHGTLTLADPGNLNFATGEFVDNLTVVGGTGGSRGRPATCPTRGCSTSRPAPSPTCR